MKLFSVFLALTSILSGNIQFTVYFSFLLLISYINYEKTSSIIPYLFAFVIAYPVSFTGESVWDRNIIYIFTIFILVIDSFERKQSFITVAPWQKRVLLTLIIASFVVYIPILIETYLNLEIFNGPEVFYISNHRDSHMLGFALPMIFGPLLIMTVITAFNHQMNLENLYSTLKLLTWIVVVLSLIRYIMQVEFIPQSYIDTIRNNGFRLSGFNHPDSISYGKMLLIPLAFILSYRMSKFKFHLDAYLLFFILISLFMTFSRILIATSIVIIFIVTLYNFKLHLIIKGIIYFYILINILFYTGGIEKLMSRSLTADNTYGVNWSGRDLIYESTIPIIMDSPYVGLRPGGYVSMLIKGFSYTRDGYTGTMIVRSAHSFYLVVALEWGLPLLFFIVGIMLHCIYLMHLTIRLTSRYIYLKDFPSIRVWAVATIAVIIGLLFMGITDFIPYPIIFFLIGLSWSLYLIAKKSVSQCLKLKEYNLF